MKINVILLLAILLLSGIVQGQVRIKMEKDNGIYKIPCIVNGLKMRFIFDTGASYVCISLSEASFMLRNGYLSQKDIIGNSKASIADGGVVENTVITLKEIDVAGIKLYNVKAMVMHNLEAPLLLGQSAIQRLGVFQLDDDELVILKGKPQSDVQYQPKEEMHQLKTEKLASLTNKMDYKGISFRYPRGWISNTSICNDTIFISCYGSTKKIAYWFDVIAFPTDETNISTEEFKKILNTYTRLYRFGSKFSFDWIHRYNSSILKRDGIGIEITETNEKLGILKCNCFAFIDKGHILFLGERFEPGSHNDDFKDIENSFSCF